ncbi:MAG TPA: MFS transporter [Roseiarcus sp.]
MSLRESTSSPTAPARIGRSDPAFWRITGPLFVGGLATFAVLYSVQPLMPVFAREFAVSPAIASLALSATTGVLAVAMIAAGTLSEVWGRKRIMVVSLAASSLATMLTALAPNWPVLLALRALAGLALSGLPAVAMAYLGDEMDSQALGLAMGLYIAGSTLGGMSGRIAVAALSDLAGWRWAIAAAGAVGLVGAALIAAGLPRGREASRRGASPGLRDLAGTISRHLAEPGLRLLFAEGFLLMGAFVCAYNYTGFRLAEPPFSLSQTMIGLVFVLYLAGAVSSTVMGDLAGRYGRRRVLWIAIAIELAGIIATLPNSLPLVVVGIGLITWGFFGAHSIASSWVGLRTQTARAQASALYLFFYYLGSSVVGSSGGVFFQRLGWPGVAGLLAALTACALLIALRLSKVPPPAHLRAR